jgi:hypothetical protein
LAHGIYAFPWLVSRDSLAAASPPSLTAPARFGLTAPARFGLVRLPPHPPVPAAVVVARGSHGARGGRGCGTLMTTSCPVLRSCAACTCRAASPSRGYGGTLRSGSGAQGIAFASAAARNLRYARSGERDGVDEGEDGVGLEALGLKLSSDDALDVGIGHSLHAVKTFLELLDVCCRKQSRRACDELPQFDVLRRSGCQFCDRELTCRDGGIKNYNLPLKRTVDPNRSNSLRRMTGASFCRDSIVGGDPLC